MTAPVSLLPGAALPAAAGTAATPGTPDDVFASVLAALSGALGLPVPVQGQPQLPDAAAHEAGAPAGATAAPPAAGTADASPVGWVAVTQRPALPAASPTAPVTARAGEVPAAPTALLRTSPTGHATDAPTDAPATAPAAPPATEDVRPPEAAAPAVPAQEAAPAVDAAAVPPAPVVHTAPAVHVHAEAPVAASTSTHHVKPALVEAARGLRHEGGGRTSLVVRLDPPELGAVLVRLTVQDGRVDVTLRTPDLAARADLQAQSYDVEQVLREQGFDLSSFDVAHGDVLPDGRGDAPDRGTPGRDRRADGHPASSPVTDDGPAPEPSGTWL